MTSCQTSAARAWLFAFVFLASLSCLSRRPLSSFEVVPHNPDYLLRSPDALDTPFPDILRRYNGFERGRNSMYLRPQMQLRIENAYYQQGRTKRGLDGFLGTEIARYEVAARGGLRLLSVQPMKDRPVDQFPVQRLIPASQRNYRHHRFYFEILFRQNHQTKGSVLLSANSTRELDRLAAQLTGPDAVCNARSSHCTVFPEACSVSIEMNVVVNGAPQSVLWDTVLASVADHPSHLELLRPYARRLLPVKIDPQDSNALRLPLLPGDHVNWN